MLNPGLRGLGTDSPGRRQRHWVSQKLKVKIQKWSGEGGALMVSKENLASISQRLAFKHVVAPVNNFVYR